MFNLRHILVAATIVATFFSHFALAQSGNPAVYGALPDITEVQISPDGKSLAVLRQIQGANAVVFSSLEDPSEAPTGVNVGGINARDIRWVSNDTLLVMVSMSENVPTNRGLQTIEFFRWLAVSKSTGKAAVLFGNEAGYYIGSAGSLLSTLPDDPDHILMARNSTSGRSSDIGRPSRIKGEDAFAYSLFRVNLKSGRARRVESGTEDTRDWVVNAAGEAIVRIDVNRNQNLRKIYTRAPGSSNFKMLTSIEEKRGYGATLVMQAASNNPNIIHATAYDATDRLALVEFDLTTGKIGETVFSDAQYDVDEVVYDPRTARVTSVFYIDDFPRAFQIDEADRKTQAALARSLPGAAPMIVSRSADSTKLIVEVLYADHPKQFFLFDRSKKSLNMIAASYTALDGKVAAKKEQYNYTASDGPKIPGYLTVPVNKPTGPAPLIVRPHGGPASRSDQSFDYWSFFYASRGYLVYQPNFRGSDGYGYSFKRAGYGEWGRKMQSDITEGVQQLIADGIADPDRICIVGASYGGYAALAGATLTPDLYACAVSVNGISNLPGMLGAEARDSELAGDYWEVRIGSRFRDAGALNAVSPAKIAAQAGPPIMLIASKDDVVVPIGQSRQMRSALKAAGKPHEYVELDGEDHWLSTGETRTEMLRRTISFIDQHIGQ